MWWTLTWMPLALKNTLLSESDPGFTLEKCCLFPVCLGLWGAVDSDVGLGVVKVAVRMPPGGAIPLSPTVLCVARNMLCSWHSLHNENKDQ